MTDEEYLVYWNLPKWEKRKVYLKELHKITDERPWLFYRYKT